MEGLVEGKGTRRECERDTQKRATETETHRERQARNKPHHERRTSGACSSVVSGRDSPVQTRIGFGGI